MTTLAGRRILLIISGGIAAYKSLVLIRRLKDAGAAVEVVMTRAATEFVTPLAAASLSGSPVRTDLFSLTDEARMGHIELSRSADLIVVAPATADLLAKMANGLADDLASTTLLATDTRVLVAPAMNVRMWQAPATQRNLATLKADGVLFAGPDDGPMACGEFGPGRMAEPETIVAAVVAALAPPTPNLVGKHVVVTAGPTLEPIDPVRFLSNRSSGKQGYAVAAAALAAGARVTLISGPVAIEPPKGATLVRVETAQEMLAAAEAALPADIFIAAAAVADWRAAAPEAKKLKKTGSRLPSLTLTENPDILRTIATRKNGRPKVVVGFAAETDDLVAHAQAKLKAKGCDLIVANSVAPGTDTFGSESNQVLLINARGAVSWPRQSKDEVARKLMMACVELSDTLL